MSTKYFALLTELGADKLANAVALGTKLAITHMAVGDGGGVLPTPDTIQTKLVNERRRAAINTLNVDPKNAHQIIAEQVIPESEGGWWIREIGLFDQDGILIAVGNCPETYKPQLQEGSGRTQTIRMVLIVSHTDAVTLKIDPSVVLATREYTDAAVKKAIDDHEKSRRHPDATLKEKGFVVLSNAVNSESETQAATPKSVKTAYDLAVMANNNVNGRLEKAKNGADIQNRDEFVKNLGFIEQQMGHSAIAVMSQNAVTQAIAAARSPDASTTQKGVVQLTSSRVSGSETLAATANAVAQNYSDILALKNKVGNASTTQKGIVQLSDSRFSFSSDTAATSLAVSQNYTDMKGMFGQTGNKGRVLGLTHTNNQSFPIFVHVDGLSSTGSNFLSAAVDGVNLRGSMCANLPNQRISICFMVPAGAKYYVERYSGTITDLVWVETDKK
ncbi:phage tail protein [Xenorhabdus sp. M]|uniref:Phage tail protein n=1 Tax=Xenorhabdus szentirmaii TaxID=290112 RepID=A0AAW3YQI1_9GAMM|nr:phage tail protein [Xenorhabdus sp. M]MBD2800315.1 phage tail protein [Xenorhabdus sp. M]